MTPPRRDHACPDLATDEPSASAARLVRYQQAAVHLTHEQLLRLIPLVGRLVPAEHDAA